MTKLFGAVDLGASSGRVIAARYDNEELSLTEVYRFSNSPKKIGDRLCWDFESLLSDVRRGLRELGARAERMGLDVESIGIDTWAVDFGLLQNGKLIAPVDCYRDPQNEVGVREVHSKISLAGLYKKNGLQFLPFNSIYQLAKQAVMNSATLTRADTILLLPDLIGYELTGKLATERTNASSTGLLNPNTGEWDETLFELVGLNPSIFPKLSDAGDLLGPLRTGFGPRLSQTKVVLVGSHDTASAVLGVPSLDPNFAFLSSGTWSLLGAELEGPILSEEARAANFTNERGVDGRNRFLKNLSGLWLLSECIKEREAVGEQVNLQDLLSAASQLSPTQRLQVNDPRFISPGGMNAKINQQLIENGFAEAKDLTQMTAIILHSLAQTYAKEFEALTKLSGRTFSRLHIIGGGSQNPLLNQLTANYTGLEVMAGPAEATALGNILVQIRSAALGTSSLEELRAILLRSQIDTHIYSPAR